MSERTEIEAAVDEFAAAMKTRMLSKLKQGWTGWDRTFIKSDASKRMLLNASHAHEHGDEKSLIDTANLAMIVWRFKEPNRE